MPAYVELGRFKDATSIPDTATDDDAGLALEAASRAVEELTCRRSFFLDAEPRVRWFTALTPALVHIDDAAELVEVAVRASDSIWRPVTGYTTGPANAVADARPIQALRSGEALFPLTEQGIRVTGRFGWPSVPVQVTQFVTIIAAKLLKRTREAPWGVVTTGGLDGTAVRLAQTDPDLGLLIGPLMRDVPAVA